MKKQLLLYLIIFTLFMVLACPLEPPASNLPSVQFGGMEVTAAGEADVLGVYDETGTCNGKTLYTQSGGGGNKIFWTNLIGGPTGPFWCIYTDDDSTNGNEMDYISLSSADTPPLDSLWWASRQGSSPSPTLAPVEVFTGSATEGQTLTIQYVFSDPDPDDTEGATTFRWFLCADPADDGVEIPGAVSQSYTIQTGQAGSCLKVEVTPVDNHGDAGTAVMSPASDIIIVS